MNKKSTVGAKPGTVGGVPPDTLLNLLERRNLDLISRGLSDDWFK
jgi:hypothetical protein